MKEIEFEYISLSSTTTVNRMQENKSDFLTELNDTVQTFADDNTDTGREWQVGRHFSARYERQEFGGRTNSRQEIPSDRNCRKTTPVALADPLSLTAMAVSLPPQKLL
jgi:hypothetical protein